MKRVYYFVYKLYKYYYYHYYILKRIIFFLLYHPFLENCSNLSRDPVSLKSNKFLHRIHSMNYSRNCNSFP